MYILEDAGDRRGTESQTRMSHEGPRHPLKTKQTAVLYSFVAFNSLCTHVTHGCEHAITLLYGLGPTPFQRSDCKMAASRSWCKKAHEREDGRKDNETPTPGCQPYP